MMESLIPARHGEQLTKLGSDNSDHCHVKADWPHQDTRGLLFK